MIIKKYPEDFIVEEIPAFKIFAKGEYAIYRMKKIGLTTEDAIERICNVFKIPRNKIKYAGNKDKNAITTQYISIYKEARKLTFNNTQTNITIEFLGYSKEPLSLGTLNGNSFAITVRGINDHDIGNFNRRIRSGLLVLPNYFDTQRFSQNNVNIGACILRKEFKEATDIILESHGDYEREIQEYLSINPKEFVGAIRLIPQKILQLYIHAVQSFIFNDTLSSMITTHALNGDLEFFNVQYNHGNFVFFEDTTVYGQLECKDLEIFGFGSKPDNEFMENALKKLGVKERDFIIRAIPDLSVEGGRRESFILVQNIKYEVKDDEITYDDKGMPIKTKLVTLQFSLPKSSYATTVIKALFGG